jgi:hypothetical protein
MIVWTSLDDPDCTGHGACADLDEVAVVLGTSRDAEATARELSRLPYSRSSFERVGHEVGTLYRRAQPRIEEALIQAYAMPAEARSVSVSIDRVALPMEEAIEAPPGPRSIDRDRTCEHAFGRAVRGVTARPRSRR